MIKTEDLLLLMNGEHFISSKNYGQQQIDQFDLINFILNGCVVYKQHQQTKQHISMYLCMCMACCCCCFSVL